MDKNLNDYLGKYFNQVYFLPQIDGANLENLYIKIIDDGIKSLNLSSQQFDEIIKDLQGEYRNIKKHIHSLLNTIRKIKAFKKIFLSNISRLQRDVFIPDLILISCVESSNLEL